MDKLLFISYLTTALFIADWSKSRLSSVEGRARVFLALTLGFCPVLWPTIIYAVVNKKPFYLDDGNPGW